MPEQIYNTDETGLLWKCLPQRTLVSTHEKSAPGFKKAKDMLFPLFILLSHWYSYFWLSGLSIIRTIYSSPNESGSSRSDSTRTWCYDWMRGGGGGVGRLITGIVRNQENTFVLLHLFCRPEKKRNKRLQVAFTHARVPMGASVYSHGEPWQWRRLIW